MKKVRFHKLLKIKLCTINSNNTYKKLENEIGFLLFERGWDARLTEEGKLFAEEVENLLTHWEYSITQAQRISNEEKGSLRIGLLESVAKG